MLPLHDEDINQNQNLSQQHYDLRVLHHSTHLWPPEVPPVPEHTLLLYRYSKHLHSLRMKRSDSLQLVYEGHDEEFLYLYMFQVQIHQH